MRLPTAMSSSGGFAGYRPTSVRCSYCITTPICRWRISRRSWGFRWERSARDSTTRRDELRAALEATRKVCWHGGRWPDERAGFRSTPGCLLARGAPEPSAQVLPAVVTHAVSMPLREACARRWTAAQAGGGIAGRRVIILRPAMLIILLALTFALGGFVYYRLQPMLVGPAPSHSPSPSPVRHAARPGHPHLPTGHDPDQPGPVDRARPDATMQSSGFTLDKRQDAGRRHAMPSTDSRDAWYWPGGRRPRAPTAARHDLDVRCVHEHVAEIGRHHPAHRALRHGVQRGGRCHFHVRRKRARQLIAAGVGLRR